MANPTEPEGTPRRAAPTDPAAPDRRQRPAGSRPGGQAPPPGRRVDRSADEPFPSRSRKRESQRERQRDAERDRRGSGAKESSTRAAVAAGRNQLANVVRIVFILLALILAVGAFLVAVRDNVSNDNAVVKFIWNVADAIDGPFSRDNGIFTFHGKNAETKDAVVNWGIAAIFYLVVGNILTRFIRPGARPAARS